MWCWLLLGIVLFLAAVRKIFPVYLNGIDSILLTGDPECRTSTIHAVMVTSKPATVETLRRFIDLGFTPHQRFKNIAVRRSWLWHYWTPAPNFDVENHIIAHPSVSGEGSAAQHAGLEKWLSGLLMRPLREDRPLWEFHLLEKYGGGSVIVFRIHHCMGDGIGLLRFAVAMMRKEMEACPCAELSSAGAVSGGTPAESKSAAPKARAPRARRPKPTLAETVRKGALATLKLLALPADPVSPLKAASAMLPSTKSNTAWSRVEASLATVKRIAAGTGGSVNDVLFSVVAGAYGKYLTSKGLPLPKQSMQSVLWVSLRGVSVDGPPAFGNNLGCVYLKFPIQVADASQRVEIVRKQTAELVASPEPFVSSFVLRFFGLWPAAIAGIIWRTTAFKVTASCSNLPGPASQLQIAGAPLSQFIFFVPPAVRIGHFCTILSYNGKITFGFACDERLVPEPHELVALCHAELEHMERVLPESTAAPAPSLPLTA